jgi:GxxExxY protein
MTSECKPMSKQKSELIYGDLSYKLMGILFKVHRKLGSSYQEKYYQRAITLALDEAKIPYEREVMINLSINNQNIGKYYLDFVINKKIALEIKAVPRINDEY